MFWLLFQHKYIRIGGGYRHSLLFVKAMLEEIELRVNINSNEEPLFSINLFISTHCTSHSKI